MIRCKIQETPLHSDELYAAVSHPGAGAVDLFLGVVRATSDGREVSKLEYQAYDAMAVREMERICAEVERDWPTTKVAVTHRTGVLSVGEIAVICAASAPHRGEAFAACRALIDRIKATVPIWKREFGPDGVVWVGWQDARCHGNHG